MSNKQLAKYYVGIKGFAQNGDAYVMSHSFYHPSEILANSHKQAKDIYKERTKCDLPLKSEFICIIH